MLDKFIIFVLKVIIYETDKPLDDVIFQREFAPA